ncbi:MAG: DMP19 family protein [Syntrophobacteraceae bacterium]|jgi:hypothetical protein
MAEDTREMNRRLIRLAEGSEVRFWRVNYDALSVPERFFRAIWELEAEVNNGGFHQYFSNSSGRLVPDVIDALHAIGAIQMANIVGRAIEAVGPDVSWSDDTARQARMDDLSPEIVEALNDLGQAFYAYPDNLTALLYRYVVAHKGEIGAPAEF